MHTVQKFRKINDQVLRLSMITAFRVNVILPEWTIKLFRHMSSGLFRMKFNCLCCTISQCKTFYTGHIMNYHRLYNKISNIYTAYTTLNIDIISVFSSHTCTHTHTHTHKHKQTHTIKHTCTQHAHTSTNFFTLKQN